MLTAATNGHPTNGRENDYDALYTPLDVAHEELRRRWHDQGLKKAVLSFCGGRLPPFLGTSPCAWLGRHVVTPNLEFSHFVSVARHIGLPSVCGTFTGDKFVPENPDKYHLANMYFHLGTGRNGGHKIKSVKVLDFHGASGRRFDELVTTWGEPLVGFHHRLVRALFPAYACDCDVSDWWMKHDGVKCAYTQFYALLTCFAVLFENYDLSGPGEEFTRTVAWPAHKATVARFGVKPLIVRLLPPETENDLYWYCYPAALKPIVDASLRGNSCGARVGSPKAVEQINQNDHAVRLP